MADTKAELEQALLRSPFDLALRARYAELLEQLGDLGSSAEQWLLVAAQDGESAEPFIRAALCAHAAGDSEAARAHLRRAESRADFASSDPRIAAMSPPRAAEHLRLVHGGRAQADVPSVLPLPRAADVVRFDHIVGMDELKKTVRLRIVEPFARPGLFERFKKRVGGGVLLYGPPGCGKTLIARAIASECGATFTGIGVSDILNMWVGASEQNLAAVFDKARSSTPAVLFFDELDALAFARSKARSEHTRTLVNEFLSQLDGVGGRNERILVLAATNMPWDVDEAMKRPGRFDRQVFVPPPDAAARAEMLRVKLAGVPCGAIAFDGLAARCQHFSGADVDGLIEEAKERVLAHILAGGEERPLEERDLVEALGVTRASTLDWLKTARNLVKFGGAGDAYQEVERYLRAAKLY